MRLTNEQQEWLNTFRRLVGSSEFSLEHTRRWLDCAERGIAVERLSSTEFISDWIKGSHDELQAFMMEKPLEEVFKEQTKTNSKER